MNKKDKVIVIDSLLQSILRDAGEQGIKPDTLKEAAEHYQNKVYSTQNAENDYEAFKAGAQYQKEQLLVEIEKAESESFDGWSEEAKNGYLTACERFKNI